MGWLEGWSDEDLELLWELFWALWVDHSQSIRGLVTAALAAFRWIGAL